MAYGQKYEIQFRNLQNDLCKVKFFFDGYSGAVTQLVGADKPFVLREFNNDEDLFKPLRPQIAEISFINESVTLDDFIGNNDAYCYVGFEYLSTSQFYWTGYLLQDDFQEDWVDNKHIITLRATEGLGLLKTVQLDNGSGAELRGNFSVLDLIQYASSNTVPNWNDFSVINNLYQEDMDISLPEPSIDQCFVDANTFSVGDGEYEDKYTVLEKINRAFNQTLLQYKGAWHIYRIEEAFAPLNMKLPMRSFSATGFPNQWVASFQRFDLDIGVNEEIVPIAPNMIRFIQRPTKVDRINYIYNYPTELVPNQNWSRGTLLVDGGSYKTYSVNNWSAKKGYRETPSPSTVNAWRKDTIDTYGNVTDSYIYLENESTLTPFNYNWWQSEDIKVNKGDVLDISFSWKWNESGLMNSPIPTFNVAQILYKAGSIPERRAGLMDDGTWKVYPGDWDSLSYGNQAFLTIKPDASTLDENGWTQKSVLSKPIIKDGIIRVLLTNSVGQIYDAVWQQLTIRLQGSLNGLTTSNIGGQYEKYTKTADIKQNFEDEIYLDNSPNYNFMGALYNSSSALLTPVWYRTRYQDEEFGFKKQNLIAHWQNNRLYKNKIDATFFGLKKDSTSPVGLMSILRFVNDDSDKLYAIANMKEIDFQNATWSATLAQIYDSTDEYSGYDLYQATVNNATYTTTDPLPVTLNHSQWFSVVDNTKITYQGVYNSQFIGQVDVSFSGTINTTTTTPVTAQFYLKKNGTTIATGNVNVTTNPQNVSFTINSSNQTLNTGDYFQVSFSSEITSFTESNTVINLGPYQWPITQTFDTYKKDYIYK